MNIKPGYSRMDFSIVELSIHNYDEVRIEVTAPGQVL